MEQLNDIKDFKVPRNKIPAIDSMFYKNLNFNKSNENNSEIYEMVKIPRGFCIIFNMIKFDDNPDLFKELQERTLSKENVNKLKELFEQLNFDVKIYENFTDEKLREKLKKIIEKLNSEQCVNHDAFILYIGTHGVENGFICSNTKIIQYQQIIHLFTDESVNKFKNKPKLLFFDCCRGGKIYLNKYN